MTVTPKEAIKKRKVYIYARVSTRKQVKTLPTQVKDVERQLKKLGYKGKPEIFMEQGSGTNPNRPKLIALLEAVRASKEPSVIVVRDIQRIARNTRLYGHMTYPLIDENIPIVALQENIVTGTKKTKSPQGELLAGIFVSAGGQEVDTRTQQTEAGLVEAAAEGIVAGTPINLYPKDAVNPVRELHRLMKMGVQQGEVARRVGRSSSWAKDAKFKMNDIREAIGEDGLEEWLDVGDMIRNMEIQHGARLGKYSTKPMIAIKRKTSGYLKFPERYPAPTQEDLDRYFKDYKLYQPKRG